jgi:hypothetical protein
MEHRGLHKQWACLRGGCVQGPCEVEFLQSASLNDPTRLFNAGLDAKATRAIDFTERDKITEPALKALIREAVAYNSASTGRST